MRIFLYFIMQNLRSKAICASSGGWALEKNLANSKNIRYSISKTLATKDIGFFVPVGYAGKFPRISALLGLSGQRPGAWIGNRGVFAERAQ